MTKSMAEQIKGETALLLRIIGLSTVICEKGYVDG